MHVHETDLFSVSSDRTLRKWDIEEGKAVPTGAGSNDNRLGGVHKAPIAFVTSQGRKDANGAHWIAYGAGNSVYELNIATNRRVVLGPRASGTALCGALVSQPDATVPIIAVGYSDGKVLAYGGGAVLGSLTGLREAVRALAFHAPTGRLFACGDDQSVQRWEIGRAKLGEGDSGDNARELRAQVVTRSFGGTINTMALGGSFLFYADRNLVKRAAIDDASLIKQQTKGANIVAVLNEAHDSVVCAMCADEAFLFSGDWHGSVVTWNLEKNCAPVLRLQHPSFRPVISLMIHNSVLFHACDDSDGAPIVAEWELFSAFEDLVERRRKAQRKESDAAAAAAASSPYAKLSDVVAPAEQSAKRAGILFVAEALFKFSGIDDTELNIAAGDRVGIVEDDPGHGWVLAVRLLGDGRVSEERGFVPSRFVRAVSEKEVPANVPANRSLGFCAMCRERKATATLTENTKYKKVCQPCHAIIALNGDGEASGSADESRVLLGDAFKLRQYRNDHGMWRRADANTGLIKHIMNRGGKENLVELLPTQIRVYAKGKSSAEGGDPLERYSLYHAEVADVYNTPTQFELVLGDNQMKLRFEYVAGRSSGELRVSGDLNDPSATSSSAAVVALERVSAWTREIAEASAKLERRWFAQCVTNGKAQAPQLDAARVEVLVRGSLCAIDPWSQTSVLREAVVSILRIGFGNDDDAVSRTKQRAQRYDQMLRVQEQTCNYVLGNLSQVGAGVAALKVSRNALLFGSQKHELNRAVTDHFEVTNGGSGALLVELHMKAREEVQCTVEPTSFTVNVGESQRVTVTVTMPFTTVYEEFLELRIQNDLCRVFVPLRVESQASTELAFDDLEFGDTLGSGGFGTVVMGAYRERTVAIKVVPNPDDWRQERDVMRKLPPHKNVVEFIGSCTRRPFQGLLVFEYCPLGSLDKLIYESEEGVSPQLCVRLARDIASALAFMHDKNVLHLDMKPGNVLILSTDVRAEVCAKLCDLGMSHARSNIETYKGDEVDGTLIYMAPEMISGKVHSPKNDIWSCGVLIWEMCMRELPYSGEKFKSLNRFKFTEAIENGEMPGAMPTNAPPPVLSLIKQCLQKTHSKRPTAAALLSALQQIPLDKLPKVAPPLLDKTKKLREEKRRSMQVALPLGAIEAALAGGARRSIMLQSLQLEADGVVPKGHYQLAPRARAALQKIAESDAAASGGASAVNATYQMAPRAPQVALGSTIGSSSGGIYDNFASLQRERANNLYSSASAALKPVNVYESVFSPLETDEDRAEAAAAAAASSQSVPTSDTARSGAASMASNDSIYFRMGKEALLYNRSMTRQSKNGEAREAPEPPSQYDEAPVRGVNQSAGYDKISVDDAKSSGRSGYDKIRSPYARAGSGGEAKTNYDKFALPVSNAYENVADVQKQQQYSHAPINRSGGGSATQPVQAVRSSPKKSNSGAATTQIRRGSGGSGGGGVYYDEPPLGRSASHYNEAPPSKSSPTSVGSGASTEPWKNEKFYHRGMSRTTATNTLIGMPIGSFIVRDSSNAGHLAISHVERAGTVGHGVINVHRDPRGVPTSFSLEDSKQMHKTLRSMLKSLPLNHTAYGL